MRYMFSALCTQCLTAELDLGFAVYFSGTEVVHSRTKAFRFFVGSAGGKCSGTTLRKSIILFVFFIFER